MTTVLICDDHRLVREALRRFVEQVPGVDRVETAASGEEVLARYPLEQPDLVLMDVRMPGLGGLEATRRLVVAYPAVKIVILTAIHDREHVLAALGHGAWGYLSKDVSREQLCVAVADALVGADLVEPSLRRALAPGQASRNNPPAIVLTERELQVLTGMSQGKTNGQIGRALYLSEDTIKTHARRLFGKLGASDRAQAVALGFRRGLVT